MAAKTLAQQASDGPIAPGSLEHAIRVNTTLRHVRRAARGSVLISHTVFFPFSEKRDGIGRTHVAPAVQG
jgi:urease beta subunit